MRPATDSSIPLPDGTTYRTVPVHQGIKVIRTWAEHPWPMTRKQALTLRDHFGWTSSPTKEHIFTTNHNTRPKDASFTTRNDGTVSTFDLKLSSFAPIELDPLTQPLAWAAFETYLEVLRQLYGQGKKERRKEVTSVTWTLSSGASIRFATTGSLVNTTIHSPEYNEAAAAEEVYFDEYISYEDEFRQVPVQPSKYQHGQ
ncbi:MAG: DUF6301 family protein [Propionibacteriaceae bacterium]|nr:DUF6301 family protein [Propionibacteriaceae bacterium]